MTDPVVENTSLSTPEQPPTSSNHANSVVENPHGYPPFDLHRVPTYTNNQLRYYQISGALLNVDKTRLKDQLQERKNALELVDWDGDTRENTPNPPSIATSFLSPRPPSDSHILSFNDDSEADSDCPQTVAHRKGLKFNVSDITRLRYNSNVAQFNNWLADLKSAFDGDPAKFPTNRHKIILASMTMDEQLKTSYNSIVLAHPTISSHWRKFKRWIQSVVLHGDSDKLKLSTEFTMARQRPNEDPNQFYLRLFNLGIQTSRTVDIEDFRTRLVKPLQNLLLQHDRTYPNTQDIVVHAARLWQTMDPEKIKQEIKEDRERRQQRRQVEQGHQSFKPGRGSNQSHRRQTTHLSGRRPQQNQQNRFNNRNNERLSSEEQQYRTDNNLCYRCGYPGHAGKECSHRFNPNRVDLKAFDKNQNRSQQQQGQKRPFAKSNPVQVTEDDIDLDSPIRTESEDDSEPSSKRQKK